MSLPSVDPSLPNEIRAQHARRLARFLRHLDDRCRNQLRLVIYGSAAVSLYLADREDIDLGFTKDIDVGRMEPRSVEVNIDSGSVEPPLQLQLYDIEQWLVHPDWEDAILR